MNRKLAALLAGATVLTVLTVGCSKTSTKAVETPGATTGKTAAGESAPGGAATPSAPGASGVVEQTPVTAPAAPAGAPSAPGTAAPAETTGAAPGASATPGAPAAPGQTPVGGEATGSRTEAIVTPPSMSGAVASSVPVAPPGTPNAGNSYNLYTIYFDFDKSVIRADAKSVLDTNFDLLSKNQGTKVQIVGHCDERGSNEYNMALGERRAASTRAYLINRGILADRLTTLSKGEEEPAEGGHNEAAWAKNRRAQFVGQ